VEITLAKKSANFTPLVYYAQKWAGFAPLVVYFYFLRRMNVELIPADKVTLHPSLLKK